MSQYYKLPNTSKSHITIITIQKTISNPNIHPTHYISKLTFTNSTPKTLNIKIKIKNLNNHYNSFTQKKPTKKTQLLSTYKLPPFTKKLNLIINTFIQQKNF